MNLKARSAKLNSKRPFSARHVFVRKSQRKLVKTSGCSVNLVTNTLVCYTVAPFASTSEFGLSKEANEYRYPGIGNEFVV
jgi:hypothetical protein